MPALPIRSQALSKYGDVRMVSTSVTFGTLTDSATTSFLIAKPAVTECQLLALNFGALVAALSAGGTVLAQVFKRNNVPASPADVTLTGTKSLEADIITTLDWTYSFALTATSYQNLTFQVNDACRIDVVCTSSVGTQPVVTFNALWAIIKP